MKWKVLKQTLMGHAENATRRIIRVFQVDADRYLVMSGPSIKGFKCTFKYDRAYAGDNLILATDAFTAIAKRLEKKGWVDRSDELSSVVTF